MLRAYWRSRRWAALLVVLGYGVVSLVYFLYFLSWGPALYTMLMLTVLVSGAAAVDFRAYRRRMNELARLEKKAGNSLGTLPKESDPLLARYLSLTAAVEQARRREAATADASEKAAREYYTLWSHQVKTPIAALKLLLDEPEPDRGAMELELVKLEQYADMALQYQRLSATGNDLSFETRDAGELVRLAVRRVSPLLIGRQIRLELGDLHRPVLTDAKWLTFVLEQVLTNAAKYTRPGGRVRVYFLPEGCTMVVEDTGIGIRPEDLPRVFEWGYTGSLDRAEGRATGIGLALCRQAMEKLGQSIGIESQPGKGTRVLLDLERNSLPIE